jgi:ribosomal protein L37AE/L43A
MLVIFTNTNSRVQTIAASPIYKNNIIRPTLLIEKINSLTKSHNRGMLDLNTFKKLSKKLLKSHTPLDESLITKYNIDINDIKTGVQCPNCMNSPMRRIRATWVCSDCNSTSKDAHLLAIEDYALLIKDKFTISEIRGFFNLESKSIATKLITKFNLKHEGKLKGRIYFYQ